MPYPNSPFSSDFNINKFVQLNNGSDESSVTNIFENILKWLCTTPKITTFRVNTLKNRSEEVLDLIKLYIEEKFQPNFDLKLEIHPIITDVIILHNQMVERNELEIYENEVIVDTICGASILRGAHVYAPGVMGMMAGTQINDKVSVYVDIEMKCKKGLQTLYNHQKLFIANGIVKISRKDLFNSNNPLIKGIAIEITENISKCLPFGDNFLPKGSALLQNITSAVCVHVLNPQINDAILDMCAAPGNKTTHIASLMENQGKLIALEKIPRKVEQLKQQCKDFGVSNVEVYQADSTKIVRNLNDNPGKISFASETFDRILLDVPCSALGKRPQFVNTITEKAVKLLKIGGTLVYSTCTITVNENEGIVKWALEKFQCLELVKAEPYLGGPGLEGTDLSEKERTYVQRFGPNQEIDSVGFFIAKFIKQGPDNTC